MLQMLQRINMKEFRYKLEAGSNKIVCPKCLKKRFVRYIDTASGSYLPEQYGRCDRESNCGYICNPYKDELLQQESFLNITYTPKPIRYIPSEILKQTMHAERYEINTFILNLIFNIPYPFSATEVMEAAELYQLGTIASGYRTGAVTFPFIDIKGKIRAIQAKQFDDDNHTTSTDFLHSIIERYHIARGEELPEWLVKYNDNERKVSCLFGEHLLSLYPSNTVALVEAPKTAVISTLYFGKPKDKDSLLWLAVYNLSSINYDRCKVLKGRNVILFPDLSKNGHAYNLWKERAAQIQSKLAGTTFIVSDYLEKRATTAEREDGQDLADYLITKNYREFR